MDLITLIGSGLVGLVIGILALIALVGKGSWGNSLRGVLGMIPVGKPKIWAALLLVVALIGGGLSFANLSATTGSLFGGATIIGQTSSSSVSTPQNLQCEFSAVAIASGGNSTSSADSANLQHYNFQVRENAGGAILNTTLSCYRSGDINAAGKATCQVSSDTFKNELSTTDSNTYSILASSASPSKVAGVTWAQTAYLNSGGYASTSSDKEQTDLVFTGGSSAQSKQTLGVYVQLPGNTVFNYLNNQTSKNVYVKCDGKQVGYLTITKVGGNNA